MERVKATAQASWKAVFSTPKRGLVESAADEADLTVKVTLIVKRVYDECDMATALRVLADAMENGETEGVFEVEVER